MHIIYISFLNIWSIFFLIVFMLRMIKYDCLKSSYSVKFQTKWKNLRCVIKLVNSAFFEQPCLVFSWSECRNNYFLCVITLKQYFYSLLGDLIYYFDLSVFIIDFWYLFCPSFFLYIFQLIVWDGFICLHCWCSASFCSWPNILCITVKYSDCMGTSLHAVRNAFLFV